MSIVGTRPPTLDEWNKYELHHRARLAIKPGITGMWQVSGRSEMGINIKLMKRAMRDITTAENVKDAASEAMGKIELPHYINKLLVKAGRVFYTHKILIAFFMKISLLVLSLILAFTGK